MLLIQTAPGVTTESLCCRAQQHKGLVFNIFLLWTFVSDSKETAVSLYQRKSVLGKARLGLAVPSWCIGMWYSWYWPKVVIYRLILRTYCTHPGQFVLQVLDFSTFFWPHLMPTSCAVEAYRIPKCPFDIFWHTILLTIYIYIYSLCCNHNKKPPSLWWSYDCGLSRAPEN